MIKRERGERERDNNDSVRHKPRKNDRERQQ